MAGGIEENVLNPPADEGAGLEKLRTVWLTLPKQIRAV
jgi:hypothetical protein